MDTDFKYHIQNQFFLSMRKSSTVYCESPQPTIAATTTTTTPAMPSSSPIPHHHQHHQHPPPSKWRFWLSTLRLKSLPIPRLITPNDPLFSYPALQRGLKQRQKDEQQMALLEKEAMEAKQSGDIATIAHVVHKISNLAYGKGVTPQMRQDFLIQYGCAAYSNDILSLLYQLGIEHNLRGIIEIGAGNGQWAKAITDHHKKQQQQQQQQQQPLSTKKATFEFIMAYDDMSSLPLSPAIYHPKTQPANDYFYPNVRSSSHMKALQPWESRGRVLLMVFPPPGPMAVETLREYIRLDPKHNDTLVYVGEGRGGANASEAFFELLENGEWMLECVLDVGEGNLVGMEKKGFEKCFCFRRVIKNQVKTQVKTQED